MRYTAMTRTFINHIQQPNDKIAQNQSLLDRQEAAIAAMRRDSARRLQVAQAAQAKQFGFAL